MIILYFISGLYFLLIAVIWLGLYRLPKRKNTQKLSFSVIIAARNEEQNLPHLIDHLKKQTYDYFEIIIANDRSSDKTETILKQAQQELPHLHYVNVQENPSFIGKKNALRTAIEKADGEILLFTDADCLPHPTWIEEINACFTSKTDIVAGVSPLLKSIKEEVNPLKNLERLAMFGVTAGTFGWNWGLTCTARNFAYRRSIYDAVKGYEGIGHIRSGDDDLMLMKMAKVSRKMNFAFSPSSFVPSLDKTNIKSQIQLETRRASKLKFYSLFTKSVILGIFSFYTILVGLFIASFWSVDIRNLWLFLVGIKLVLEAGFLIDFFIRTKQLRFMKYFLLAEILYIPYFIFFGLKGTFGNYKWKE